MRQDPFKRVSGGLIRGKFLAGLLYFVIIIFSPFMCKDGDDANKVCLRVAHNLRKFENGLFFLGRVVRMFAFCFFRVRGNVRIFLPRDYFVRTKINRSSKRSRMKGERPIIRALRFRRLLNLFCSSFLGNLRWLETLMCVRAYVKRNDE